MRGGVEGVRGQRGDLIVDVMMRLFSWMSVAMPKLTFASITLEDLKAVIHLQEGTIGRYDWNEVTSIALTLAMFGNLCGLKCRI